MIALPAYLRSPRSSLQARFAWLVVAAASVFAVIAGIVAYQMSYRQSVTTGQSTLAGLVSAVERTAAIGAYSGDAVLLQEIADGLSRHALVAQVYIRAGSHVVRAGRGAHDPATLSAEPPATALQLTRDLISPFDQKEPVGQLTLIANPQQLDQEAAGHARLLALVMAVQVLAITVLMHMAANRLVTNPLARLARQLRRIEPGTSQRLTIPLGHRDDEIGSLMISGNALLTGVDAALQRERALRAQVESMEAQYRQIFDSSSAGIFVLDADGRMINANPTVMKLINADSQSLRDVQGEAFVRSVFARPDTVLAMMAQARLDRATASADLELLTKDGSKRWVHCLISVQDTPPPPPGTVPVEQAPLIEGMMYDVTERLHRESLAHHRAEHDPLTSLPNRSVYEARVDRWLAPAAGEAQLSLMFIDLDGFKRVNDTHGHATGDEILRICAERIKGCLRRSTDFAARIGGDEFVVVMPGASPDTPALTSTAQAILAALGAPFMLDSGLTVHLGGSIGIACSPLHGRTRPALTHAADVAMYEVKYTGKNAIAMAMRERPHLAAPSGPAAPPAGSTHTASARLAA